MWRRFSGRGGYGPVGGYRRRSVGYSYGATVLIVAMGVLILLYLMGRL